MVWQFIFPSSVGSVPPGLPRLPHGGPRCVPACMLFCCPLPSRSVRPRKCSVGGLAWLTRGCPWTELLGLEMIFPWSFEGLVPWPLSPSPSPREAQAVLRPSRRLWLPLFRVGTVIHALLAKIFWVVLLFVPVGLWLYFFTILLVGFKSEWT